MKVKNLECKTDKLLILALRAKLRELKPSIADYQRSLREVFSKDLCYHAVRNRLRKLEEQGFLKSKLIKDFVSNDLIDSEGIKLKRFTKVYKRVYAINVRNEVLKRLILALKELSKKLFKKELSEALCNNELLKSLASD